MAAAAAAGAMLPNLIRAHRDELRQASTGALDHMVIDVIGSLFDQILSDPKVPPQMARQIARLQLPVLRAALGDPSSSRRAGTRCGASSTASPRWAPLRRLRRRPAASPSWRKVRALVQEIVEGDFDQIETSTSRSCALEPSSPSRPAEVQAHGEAPRAAVGARKTSCAAASATQPAGRRAARRTGRAGLPARLRQPQVWSQACCLRGADDGAQTASASACARRPRAVHERAAQGHAGAAQGLPGRVAQADAGAHEGMA
jgi:hypothetical protein